MEHDKDHPLPTDILAQMKMQAQVTTLEKRMDAIDPVVEFVKVVQAEILPWIKVQMQKEKDFDLQKADVLSKGKKGGVMALGAMTVTLFLAMCMAIGIKVYHTLEKWIGP